MAIPETEILDSGDEGDGDEFDIGEYGSGESGNEPGRSSGSGSGSGSGDGSGSGFASRWGRWSRWYRPQNAPVLVSLVAALVVVAAAAFAAVQHDRSGDDFGVSLISAQYTVRQDASGIDLTLALQNTGSSMIELTGVSVYQPGLIRLTQTGDAAGVTETEAGATTASALGPGTAITSIAVTPKDVEVVTVPFRYDCGISNLPPVSRAVSLAGFSARGTARTARLALPTSVTPWQAGSVVRSALCNQPNPASNVSLAYIGENGSTHSSPQAPIQFSYSAELTSSGTVPIAISSISQDNPGIATSVDPSMPITLIHGRVQLTVTWWVTNCIIATSARSADGVKITATAQQDVQTWDVKLGSRFNSDLASGISIQCSGG